MSTRSEQPERSRNNDDHRNHHSHRRGFDRFVEPGRQHIPIWLTILVGNAAAFIGPALARAMGIPTDTAGVDWTELLVQVIVAAVGVALLSGLYGGGRRRRWLRS